MTRFAAPIAEQIWDMKYRFKSSQGTPIDVTVEDTWRRIATDLSKVEQSPDIWAEKFYTALEDFKFLPAGRITAGAGTARKVTLFNCFVMGTVPDDMAGIFDMLREAALTMQQGGGIGYDFSTIRPSGADVKGVAADASGPLSFMDVWDAMCRTIMSAGSRRGAMMATLRCDHPDIEAFIAPSLMPRACGCSTSACSLPMRLWRRCKMTAAGICCLTARCIRRLMPADCGIRSCARHMAMPNRG